MTVPSLNQAEADPTKPRSAVYARGTAAGSRYSGRPAIGLAGCVYSLPRPDLTLRSLSFFFPHFSTGGKSRRPTNGLLQGFCMAC